MKFYKINKSLLKFSEISQLKTDWNYPILIDKENNVIVGNSLKDSLKDEVITIIIEVSQDIKDDLFAIESKIAEENSESRINSIKYNLSEYFKNLRKEKYEEVSLFDYKDTTLITEENYIAPNETVTYAHGIKKDNEKVDEIIEEYEIDEEILKELM